MCQGKESQVCAPCGAPAPWVSERACETDTSLVAFVVAISPFEVLQS